MYAIRTRFGKDIVGEFFPPARKTKNQRVVILASGMPNTPNPKPLLDFLSSKGFWAIHFRYKGSWESSGKFLARPADEDILEVIDQLPKGFTDLWTNKKYKVKPDQIIILGASFGGAAGILASRDKRISKVVSISPLIDWSKPGPEETYPKLIKFTEKGFGESYRLAPSLWKKLQSGKYFNPINHTTEIDGTKNLIIHAKDDRTCKYSITKKFTDDTKIKLVTLPRGGHIGSSLIMQPRFYKIFKRFIETNNIKQNEK